MGSHNSRCTGGFENLSCKERWHQWNEEEIGIMMKTVLTNCTVIACTGELAKKDMTIVIDGNRIAEISHSVHQQVIRKEGEVRVIDLDGSYVLPGLWNVHAHPFDLFPDFANRLMSESPIECAIRAGRNLIDALKVGVTAVRVAGERDFIDVAWKQAFQDGIFIGPRMFVCGQVIVCTGGHGWEWDNAVEIDGPYEMRKAVREQLKHGVDQIKIAVSDGASDLLADEIESATQVAHQKGKSVCAHATSLGLKTAIKAGVDCIEHGCLMDDEAVQLMKDNNVFYDPTLVIIQDAEYLKELGLIGSSGSINPEACEEYATQHSACKEDFTRMYRTLKGRILIAQERRIPSDLASMHLESFRKALDAGVRITCGADVSPIGDYALLEIEHMVRAGMNEMQALIAATRTSAELCGVSDQLGTVEAGKLADLIVVRKNPLEDIGSLRKLKLVLRDGKLIETEEPEGSANFWRLLLS